MFQKDILKGKRILFTGGGTGLIGMWKAFSELQQLGWIGKKLPRMIAVQAEGCAPIVKAWRQGNETAELWENANTVAAGIRVPIAVGDFLIIRAVNESDGFAISVSDNEIVEARDFVSKTEGTLLCPEGAATLAAFEKSLSEGLISNNDRVILFNCASGLKYSLPDTKNILNKDQPVDYSIF